MITSTEKIIIIKKSNARWNCDVPNNMFLKASTEYVRGSINVKGASHAGNLLIGNKAPERKKIGNKRKLVIN